MFIQLLVSCAQNEVRLSSSSRKNSRMNAMWDFWQQTRLFRRSQRTAKVFEKKWRDLYQTIVIRARFVDLSPAWVWSKRGTYFRQPGTKHRFRSTSRCSIRAIPKTATRWFGAMDNWSLLGLNRADHQLTQTNKPDSSLTRATDGE